MQKIKVLFVDDDIELGVIIAEILHARGFEISFHNSIIGIVGVVRDYKPDIIILDIELGAEDGISYIPAIKDIVPEVPIIVTSSHTDYSQIDRAFQAKAVDFIKKPYHPQELEIYIRKNIVQSLPYLIQIGGLTLNTQTRELCEKKGILIKRLSQMEYHFFKLLANYKNELVSREEIEKVLWGSERCVEIVGNDYTLNNVISALRKLIAVDPNLKIVTHKGVGYRLMIS